MNAWQPIATAPKDGREIVILTANQSHYIGEFCPELKGWVNSINFHDLTPTHWMAIPAAPEVKP